MQATVLQQPVLNSSGLPKNAILMLALAAFGSGMSMRTTDAMLIRLATDFSVSLGTAALAITVFAVAYGVSQLLFGPLGDRYGKYRIVGWGCIASAVTSLSCALVNDFNALLLARLLAGVSCASVIPLSMAWIGDVIDYQERQSVLARFLIGQILGLSSGILLGGLAADYLSWRAPFLLISICFLLTGLCLIKINRSLPELARRVHTSEGRAIAGMLSSFTQIAAIHWARQVLYIVSLEGALVFGALAFIPSHLHRAYGVSLAFAGACVMLFGLGGFVFAMRSKKLVQSLGELGLIRRGGLLMAGSLIGIALSPNVWLSMPACFFLGLGFYMMHNTLQINATQMAPERRGAAVASFAACFFLGQSLGVALAGIALNTLGTPLVLGSAGVGVWLLSRRFAQLRGLQAG
jgi:predicted MFS family arabinose efflux permease